MTALVHFDVGTWVARRPVDLKSVPTSAFCSVRAFDLSDYAQVVDNLDELPDC